MSVSVFSFIVGGLPLLHSLQITHNKLKTAEDIQHLVECKYLSNVDLAHNKLDDEKVVDVFAAMENLVSNE